jgi:hypothetical protein
MGGNIGTGGNNIYIGTTTDLPDISISNGTTSSNYNLTVGDLTDLDGSAYYNNLTGELMVYANSELETIKNE